ncbi:MAG: OmpA family protein [Bacteroidaceae bacterium]|nr:OmpA family protein [Bacteroidaceae bacterium]
MKKFMIALAFASLGTVAVNAQRTVALNPFWNNWFVQAGIDMSLANPAYTSHWSKEVFPNGKSFGVNLAIGKWFSPEIALRGKIQWENGIIDSDHQNRNRNHGLNKGLKWVPSHDGGGYAQVSADAMLNLSNIISGYSETRFWNFIPFAGAGFFRAFDIHQYTPSLRTGIENTFRLGKRANIYLDLTYQWTTSYLTDNYGRSKGEASDPARHNGIFTMELGATINLGKTNWDRAYSQAEIDALLKEKDNRIAELEAELNRLRAENAKLQQELAKLRDQLKNQPEPPKPVVRVIGSAATSVFFEKNSTVIDSEKDLVNLQAVASVAKANNNKVVVTGSADSATGTTEINQRLSEGRANVVADKLVEYGVPRANISTVYKGGVLEVEPYNLNRRAVVELK